jgi:phage terminase large subunit-like protein
MSLQRDVSSAPELAAFVRFCAALTLENGRPLAIEPFQRELLSDYFDGVVETLVILSKKNGKSTLLAALALFHLITTVDAECVIGASSRDQATILYDQAAGFVRRSPGLQERVLVKRGYREIRSRRHAGRVRVLAADVDTADGVIPTLALVDELHRHRSADLYGVFRDGLGPRHGQMVTISTAGDHELSALGQMRAAAHRMPALSREGRHLYARASDGSFALHEWALDGTDDVDDMTTVKLVNPASWQSIEALARRHDSPSMLPWQWARFACGIWTGAEAWWVRAEEWHAAAIESAFGRGDRIAIGFDGSRHGDATGIVGCRIDDALLVPLGVWEAPKGVREWDVPTSEVDAAIANAMETFDVVRGYFDPPLWQSEIDAWAREYGEPAIVRYPTNRARFMQAAERFRTDVIEGHVHHAEDERLTRHVLNAQVREARGGYYLDKSSSTEKIDLAVAAVLAYEARCDVIAAARERSGYAFL